MRQNESLRNNLIKRLKAYYVMGRNGFFTIAFSGNTLPELLLTQDVITSYSIHYTKLYEEASANALKQTEAAKTEAENQLAAAQAQA